MVQNVCGKMPFVVISKRKNPSRSRVSSSSDSREMGHYKLCWLCDISNQMEINIVETQSNTVIFMSSNKNICLISVSD